MPKFDLRVGKPLAVPLPQTTQDRIERSVGYEHTKTDVSKWQPVVKANREAESISLVQKPVRRTTSTSTLQATFKPETAMELEIAKILEASGVSEEKLGECQIPLESTDDGHMAKLRSTLFFQEIKAKRQKKIKSRAYRKIKKKARMHAKSQEYEDEETKQLNEEKRLKERAYERMTLKHKGQTKWSKRQLKQLRKTGHMNETTKAALQEQYRIHQQIVEKANEATDSSSSSEDDGEEIRGSDSEPQKGLLAMAFMKRAEQREKHEIEEQERLKELEEYMYSESSEDEDDADEGGTQNLPKQIRPQISVSEVSSVSSVKLAVDDESSVTPSEKHKSAKASIRSSHSSVAKQNGSTTASYLKVQASLQAEDTKLSSSSCVRNETAEGHPQVGHSKQGSVLGQSNRKKTAPKVSSSTKQPNNSFDLSSNSSEEQQSLIRMAFPDAEFEDEFQREKQDVEREQEEDGEDALPGWGCWGGAGIKINPKPKPKQSKKPKVSAVDSALSHVILNQKRDKKYAKYLLHKPPFPFTNKEQYEISLRAPIGNDWNTFSVFNKNIQPRIAKRKGDIIEPITLSKKQKKESRAQDTKRRKNRGKAAIRRPKSKV